MPSPAQPRIQQRTVAVPDPVVKVLLGLGGVMVDGCGTAGPTLPVAAGWDGLCVLAHQVAVAVRTASSPVGGTDLGALLLAVQKRNRS